MLSLSKYFAQALQRGYRSSALSPLLWLNSIVSIPCLLLSSRAEGPFRYVLFGLGVAVVAYTLLAYAYLVRKDPRWVQSESFQLESRKLDIIASKGQPALEAAAVEISEPALLEPGEADEPEAPPRG